MTMIILQKCFRITYQTENKQFTSSSNFYSSVCLQCSLPACLNPSVPHVRISCAIAHITGTERQTKHHGTGCQEPYLYPEQAQESPFLPLPPPSSQVPSSQKRVNILSAGTVFSSPPMPPVCERMALQQQGGKPAPAQSVEASRSSSQ